MSGLPSFVCGLKATVLGRYAISVVFRYSAEES